ncbi:DnaJ-class molecular chaperone [Salinibacter ruber]|nr:DnaJ-class molecular chaperone [Salinibacter ruber]
MRHCSKCSGHRQIACDECEGAGEKKTAGPGGETQFQACGECGGSGWVDCPRCSGPDGPTGSDRAGEDLDQLSRGESLF